VLQTREGQSAIGIDEDEEFVALIHLGPPVDEPVAKRRAPASDYVTFLA
jgi:nitroreductase